MVVTVGWAVGSGLPVVVTVGWAAGFLLAGLVDFPVVGTVAVPWAVVGAAMLAAPVVPRFFQSMGSNGSYVVERPVPAGELLVALHG